MRFHRPRSGILSAAALLAGVVAAGPPNASRSQGLDELLREARGLEASGRRASALDLYDRAVAIEPNDPDALYLRANARYRSGRVAASLADFDRLVGLVPEREPYFWQRGIAQYQTGRDRECAAQFELHRTVNPADVENAAWHFLCVASARGVESARQELLPVGRDSRVPMAELYDLFAGRADRATVLRAADQPRDGTTRRLASFYAHLYLGLFAETLGDHETARRELAVAVELGVGGYMADVARNHLALLDPPVAPARVRVGGGAPASLAGRIRSPAAEGVGARPPTPAIRRRRRRELPRRGMIRRSGRPGKRYSGGASAGFSRGA
ncbi:MAG TPA: tetratricopeptide repeat protein [Thermoanaerobaculia bacterium]|nr:tetratricopeptide repeat protein [Thermoanaerobaculia bacterium]